ncbi:MAG: helix-hairpin-helix domain-containing protein [Myxococcota bacterium]|nr:helix-hairpin-helix domain-containing protein [Myxococcota bacterium]
MKARDDAMEPLSLGLFRAALSRASARVTGSRFVKPVARVVVATAGLLLLAFIGETAIAGAIGHPPPGTFAQHTAPLESAGAASNPSPIAPASASSSGRNEPTPDERGAQSGAQPSRAARRPASPDDPVILNTATEDDLRRLPGIGAKRAVAILSLRERLGRFRAIEDLLKVRGVGRATLKRLRPLVRLDPVAASGASSTAPTSASP